ncbi:MAG: phytanoyl-CoA dioxygenase family protein [Acidimicrobiales bacterium]
MRILTPEELADFRRDGVVHVRRAVDDELVLRIAAAIDRIASQPPGPDGRRRGTGLDRHLCATDDEFRALCTVTGLAAVAAQATGSETIRIYFDQIFIKPANSPDAEFAWHQDAPYWPIGGTQVVSTWLSLTANNADSSALEFVRGSHTWDTVYRPASADGTRETMNKMWDGFGDLAHSIPDEIIAFEDHPDRYDIVSFDVEPGDALLFDYRILHRSRGNPTPTDRVAISWRWLGDEAIWDWVRGVDPVINPEHTFLQPGDPITDDETFPVVHRVAAATV